MTAERKVKGRWTGPDRLVPDLGLTLIQGEQVELPASLAKTYTAEFKPSTSTKPKPAKPTTRKAPKKAPAAEPTKEGT